MIAAWRREELVVVLYLVIDGRRMVTGDCRKGEIAVIFRWSDVSSLVTLRWNMYWLNLV